MNLMIKAMDASSDDPNFVIIEEWDTDESEHHHALRVLARRASSSPIYVGSTFSPVFRQLTLFCT